MYLRRINKNDSMYDLPETFSENMQKIEQAITDLQFEIAHLKDDIEHLKILARDDEHRKRPDCEHAEHDSTG